jgi:hypothetical protein
MIALGKKLVGAACGAVAVVALAPAVEAGDSCDAFNISFTKNVYEPDEMFFLNIKGTPGTPSFLLVDLQPGPVPVPGWGVFEVGLTPALLIAPLPPMPDSGCIELCCDFACGSDLIGIPFYFQTVSFDPQTLEPCLSNGATLFVAPDPELCDGTDGCTPGYWKQEQHFDSWPGDYDPDMPFSAVFDDAFPGMTLLDVLEQGGGGLKALGRHAVAALLSSRNPDVDNGLTSEGVIAMFNTAYAEGPSAYTDQKNFFESKNEQDCPID